MKLRYEEGVSPANTPKCPTCVMQKYLCICDRIPKIPTATRVVLLIHAGEKFKPTNTGRLAHLCLPNSEVRYRGEMDRTPLKIDDLADPAYENCLLHLSEESQDLTDEWVRTRTKPLRLIVPDGTWSQASRLGSMLAKKLPLTHVKLKSVKPSEYRVRTEHHPDGMATFEAIAQFLGIVESADKQREMEKIFRMMIDRLLYARGEMRAEDVYGGAPARPGSKP